MSLETNNHKLYKYENNDIGDLRFINDSMDKIDRGLVLDVGVSAGSDNNYILNIGEIKLGSTTKGLKLSFFADKSSSGNVTINNNYNLLNANKSPIKNLKSGVPYTVIYDGGENFFLASGGTDEVSFTSDKLLEGYTANNSDGEKVFGSMKNNGIVTQNMSINGHITLPSGYYNSININQSIATKGNSTYTPGTSNQVISGGQYLTGDQIILGDGNLRAENIKEGISIFGVNGIANALSLNGLRMASGSSDTTTEKANATYYNVFLSINCEFEPKLIICEPNFDYNRCRFLFATTLFDGSKIYSQEWQGTSSDTTKTQIVTLIKDYTLENIKKLKIGTIRSDTRTTVRWFAFG